MNAKTTLSSDNGALFAKAADAASVLGGVLSEKGLVCATAESCTGGLVSGMVTAVAGSSAWFDRGFVTYSNDAKMAGLSVSEKTLAAHGAVSPETAEEMARGAVSNSLADVAVSTTGIAGPGGAVPGKPVGTVCFGIAVKDKTGIKSASVRRQFGGDREAVRLQAVIFALESLIATVETGRPFGGRA